MNSEWILQILKRNNFLYEEVIDQLSRIKSAAEDSISKFCWDGDSPPKYYYNLEEEVSFIRQLYYSFARLRDNIVCLERITDPDLLYKTDFFDSYINEAQSFLPDLSHLIEQSKQYAFANLPDDELYHLMRHTIAISKDKIEALKKWRHDLNYKDHVVTPIQPPLEF